MTTITKALEDAGFKNRPFGMIRKVATPTTVGGFKLSPARPTSVYIVADVTPADTLTVTTKTQSDTLQDAAGDVFAALEAAGVTGTIHLWTTRL